MAHSKIGASSSARWFVCPGSVRICSYIEDKQTSFAAAQGTVAHGIVEKLLKLSNFNLLTDTQTDLTTKTYKGKTVLEGHEINIDDNMAEGVALYINTIKKYMHEYNCSFSDLEVEKSFTLDALDVEAFGTCDAILRTPNKNIVFDFKFGFNDVEVVGNKQLLYYALGATIDNIIEPKDVMLVIVQPNKMDKENAISSWEIKGEDISNFAFTLKAKIEDTKKENAKLEVQEYCKYCVGKMICP